jgi:C-terminal processing protease CtpA/Prc
MSIRPRVRGLLLIALLLLVAPLYAQDDPPPAEIANDEGGVAVVQGLMDYTNLFFTSGVAQPIVIMEDQAGFVNRDDSFIFPPASQVLGNFTSDYYEPPVSYNINLPIAPNGTLVDVDNDDADDTGVMVYTPAYWTNIFGDPFLEQRDASGAGWSTAYAGTRVNDDREVFGGKLLIYAPEEGQGFPSGFGDDLLLFTEDDPIVIVPAGWTLVDMDQDPFVFDRSTTAEIDLIEPDSIVLNDFSQLGYVEAFDAAIDLMRGEYSFTDYKNVDWDALNAEFRPRVEEAEANQDPRAFKLAIRDLSWSIPDGHVAMFGAGSQELNDQFFEATGGGLGMNIVQLDDERVIVEFVLPDGPADAARIRPGDEVIAFDGKPIQQVLDEVTVFAAPFSTDHNLLVQQLRYAIRYPQDTTVDVTFINGSTGELSTVTLTAVPENTTWTRSSILAGAPEFVGPVEYELLPEGYAYAQITTFSGNEVLTIQDWENFLTLVNNQSIPGIVIDMRYNGGGSPLLANQMAGYFYDEETIIGYRASYNQELGEFVVRDDSPTYVYPAPETFRYDGEIVVIVGPACASACETFSYAASLLDNVTIVGTYPSAGLGGGVDDFLLPEDLRFRFTVNRGLNADQEIHIEGIGVVPDVRVPITEETLFIEEDVELQTAIRTLDNALTVPFTDAGQLTPGSSAEGTLNAGERVRYTLVGPSEGVTIIVTLADADAPIELSVYDIEETLIGTVPQGTIPNLPLLASAAGEQLILEIGTPDNDVTTDYTVTLEE